jgi:hypothetical protein
MNRLKTLHFDLSFADRFDYPEIASSIAHEILTMPPSFFPLVALHDDGRRRKAIARENERYIADALLHTRTAPDDILEGEVEIEKKGFPQFHILAQWQFPRRVGLNSVSGFIPLDLLGTDKDVIGSVVEWALSFADKAQSFVYGNIELAAEWADKLNNKEPPPGADLKAWLDNPPPPPRHPPEAITDIVWLNIFGGPYVDLIGRDRLHSAPAHRTVELSGGSIGVLVSDSPLDFGEVKYAERCEMIKAHIGREYFFDWANPDRECPMPKLDVEYAKPKKYTKEEMEQLRERAGIPDPADSYDPVEKEWLEGLRDWVDRNEEHSRRFIDLVVDRRDALDYSIDSLKVLDKYILKRRKRDREADPGLVLTASAYLAQVLLRNSSPMGKATLRVDSEKGHAIVELPDGMIAVPMARIANLWNQGKEEETHFYAKSLLRR